MYIGVASAEFEKLIKDSRASVFQRHDFKQDKNCIESKCI